MKIIEVENVSRSFRSVRKKEGLKGTLELLLKPQYEESWALKGATFSIEKGEFVGLIGANGAGKTTLLKILSGLIPPTSGKARVMGFNPFERKLDYRRQIALVMGQKAQLWWDLPAADAFDLLQAIYDIPRPVYKERLKELAQLLDVEKHLHTQIRRLSLGERMKMELIGAIIHWPSVIFLDEPTIGLDVMAAHNLREFLREFNKQRQTTIILTSHNMDDIEKLCPRVIILKSGEMIYDGKPSGLTKQGAKQMRVRFLQTPTAEEVAIAAGLEASAVQLRDGAISLEDESAGDLKNYVLDIHTNQMADVLQRLLHKYQIIDLGLEGQSLESVIHRIYEGGK